MAFPFGLGAVLMFTTPELSMNGKIIYAWVTYLVMSLIYTAINIPYCSVGRRHYAQSERAHGLPVVALFLNGLATLIISSSILPLTDWLGNGDRGLRFPANHDHYGRCGNADVPVSAFPALKSGWCRLSQNESLKKDLRDIIKNDQWLLMITITFLNVFPAFIRGGVTIYYATYVMKESVGFITFFWRWAWPVICWAACLPNR
ncbi:GPH family transporter [Klebsiella michiganensis]|nr:GPH family transporter [Klebsiella michiganensis]